MAFEGPFAKVWVNVCDSLQKLGTLVSEASASPEVEKEAAINLLMGRNGVSECLESDLFLVSISGNC